MRSPGWTPSTAAQALLGVDVRVGEGEVVTLLGRDGAGKTQRRREDHAAALRDGLHYDVLGTITLDGTDITGTHPHQQARRGLGKRRTTAASTSR